MRLCADDAKSRTAFDLLMKLKMLLMCFNLGISSFKKFNINGSGSSKSIFSSKHIKAIIRNLAILPLLSFGVELAY